MPRSDGGLRRRWRGMAIAPYRRRDERERLDGAGSRRHARPARRAARSEEHTSELQSLMRISYAVFCLKKKNKPKIECKQLLKTNTALTRTHDTYSTYIS